MILVVLVLFAVLLVPVTGGSLSRLGELRLHAWGLLLSALVLQVLVISVLPGLPGWAAAGVHVGSYLLAGAFLWSNRHLPGIPVVAFGAALNGLVIALNGGTLPASAWAVRTAGLDVRSGFVNSGVLAAPHLLWLGDVFAVPAAVPFANVFSIGDLLIVAGVVILVLRATRPVPARP